MSHEEENCSKRVKKCNKDRKVPDHEFWSGRGKDEFLRRGVPANGDGWEWFDKYGENVGRFGENGIPEGWGVHGTV